MTTAQTAATGEKPVMAGKKAYDFKISKGKEADIPVTVRTGGPGLPFAENFSAMEPGDHFPVPVEFWADRGIAKAKNTAPLNKDRIRRSFYNWQAKDEKARSKFALAFSDQFTKDGKTYTGVEVYMARKAS